MSNEPLDDVDIFSSEDHETSEAINAFVDYVDTLSKVNSNDEHIVLQRTTLKRDNNNAFCTKNTYNLTTNQLRLVRDFLEIMYKTPRGKQ